MPLICFGEIKSHSSYSLTQNNWALYVSKIITKVLAHLLIHATLPSGLLQQNFKCSPHLKKQ